MLIFEHLGGMVGGTVSNTEDIPDTPGVWHHKSPATRKIAWWCATHKGRREYDITPIDAVRKLINEPAILRMAGSVSVVWPYKRDDNGYKHGDQMAEMVIQASKMVHAVENHSDD